MKHNAVYKKGEVITHLISILAVNFMFYKSKIAKMWVVEFCKAQTIKNDRIPKLYLGKTMINECSLQLY